MRIAIVTAYAVLVGLVTPLSAQDAAQNEHGCVSVARFRLCRTHTRVVNKRDALPDPAGWGVDHRLT